MQAPNACGGLLPAAAELDAEECSVKRDPSVAAAHRPLAEDSEDVRNGHEAQRAEPRVRPVEIRDPQIAKERIGNLEARDDVPTLIDLLIGRTQSQ